MQQECDRLGDELEAERKECKRLRKAATDAKVSEVALKVKLEEALTNIDILKVNLDSAVNDRDKYVITFYIYSVIFVNVKNKRAYKSYGKSKNKHFKI